MQILFAMFAFTVSSSWAAEMAMTEDTSTPVAPVDHWQEAAFKACMEQKPSYEKDEKGELAAPDPTKAFQKVSADQLPRSTPEGNLENYLHGVRTQLALCQQQKQDVMFAIGAEQFSRKILCVDSNKKILEIAARPSTKSFGDLIRALRNEMDWYQKTEEGGKASDVMYTGYNAPSIEVSAVKTAECQWPIYKNPPDLEERKASGPYYTRAAINNGALNGRGLEIAYAKSPLDVIRLQVEGSGILKIRQPNGSVVEQNIHNDGNNGHPYSSVGKAMRCLGVPESYISDAGMKRYFNEHPEKISEIVNTYRGYVFFETVKEGPKGSIGLELTPRHSVAVDKRLIPFGTVGLIAAGRPNEKSGPVESFTTLVIPQDVGSAIKNNHVDIFWGWDGYSEKAATSMKSLGTYFIGVPKKTP